MIGENKFGSMGDQECLFFQEMMKIRKKKEKKTNQLNYPSLKPPPKWNLIFSRNVKKILR